MLIFEQKLNRDILKFDETKFFQILSEDEESFYVQVTYKIDQVESIKKNFNRVQISALTKVVKPALFVESSDVQKTINDFLTYQIRSKNKREEQKNHLLGTFSSDITAFLNKDLIPFVKNNLDFREDPRFFKTVFKYSKSTFEQNSRFVKKVSSLKPPASIDPKKSEEFQKKSFSLVRGAIDPSNPPRGSEENSHISRDFFPPVKNEGKLISYKEPSLEAQVVTQFKITKTSENFFFLRFELFSSNSSEIQDIKELQVHLGDYLKNIRTIVSPPEVGFFQGKKETIFSVKQVDKNATKVSIFRKSVKTTKNKEDLKYEIFKEIDLKPGETKKINVQNPSENSHIYRFVSLNNDHSCPTFSSKVLRPSLKERDDDTIVFAKLSDEFLKLEVGIENFGDKASSLQFLIKNITLKEKVLSNLGGRISLTKEQVSGRAFSTLFPLPKPYQFFEIYCKIYYKTGLSSVKGPFVFSHHLTKRGDEKEKVQISQDFLNGGIQFSLDFNQKESRADFLKKKVFENSAENIFNEELKAQKSTTKNLTYFKIKRFNLKTGAVEMLGETEKTTFSELELTQKSGLKPATKEDSFEYSVDIISGPPEVLLKSTKKEMVDPQTSKKYIENSSKFLNKMALDRGTIPADLNKALDKNFVGSKSYSVLSGVTESSSVKEITASRLGSNLIKLDISISGNPSFFDHFILTKINIDTKTQICTIHSQFLNTLSVIYRIEKEDIGNLSFSIISVKNDYQIDSEIISNEIFIGDYDF
jgi:hypothetical protein